MAAKHERKITSLSFVSSAHCNRMLTKAPAHSSTSPSRLGSDAILMPSRVPVYPPVPLNSSPRHSLLHAQSLLFYRFHFSSSSSCPPQGFMVLISSLPWLLEGCSTTTNVESSTWHCSGHIVPKCCDAGNHRIPVLVQMRAAYWKSYCGTSMRIKLILKSRDWRV